MADFHIPDIYALQDRFIALKLRRNLRISNTQFWNCTLAVEGNNEILSSVVVGDVRLGAFTYINPQSDVRSAHIGRFSSIADGVYISPNRHPKNWLSTHPVIIKRSATVYSDSARLVTIGNDVWIGSRATIMGGTTIGDGAIVGANSVVTRDVPPYAIVTGAPARVMSYRFDESAIEQFLRLKWWNYNIVEHSGDVDFSDVQKTLEWLRVGIEDNKF